MNILFFVKIKISEVKTITGLHYNEQQQEAKTIAYLVIIIILPYERNSQTL